jgi:hypothetical protein
MTMKKKKKRAKRPIDKLDPIAYSPDEFAHVSSLSKRKLYYLWKQNKGPPFMMAGKRRIIPRRGGEEWLARGQQG